jgi:hypothetical protein
MCGVAEVVLSLSSIGISQADASLFGNTLDSLFNFRCSEVSMPVKVAAGAELQSICVADSCPLDVKADCAAYPDGVALVPVNVTAVKNGVGNGTGVANGTNSTSGAMMLANGGVYGSLLSTGVFVVGLAGSVLLV